MTAPTASLLGEELVGTSVWSRTRGTAGVDECGDQLEPLGGTVVNVLPTAEGERVFRVVTFDRGRARFDHIAESDIACASPVNEAVVRSLFRGLCAQIGRTKGPLTSEVNDCMTAAWRLHAVLMGGRG